MPPPKAGAKAVGQKCGPTMISGKVTLSYAPNLQSESLTIFVWVGPTSFLL